jgi:hypothetical protein
MTAENGIPRRIKQVQDHSEEYKRRQRERAQEKGGARELRELYGCRKARRVTAAVYIDSDSESGYCKTPDSARWSPGPSGAHGD